MPLSDQIRPSISLNVVHDIFRAVAGQQISHQLCCVHAGSRIEIQQDKINYMHEKTGEHDFSQHLACYKENENATTVATFCSVTPLPVNKNNVGIFPLLWETISGPAVKD